MNRECDKLPVTVEIGGYRKPTDEFLFTIAAPKKYQDPYVNAILKQHGVFGLMMFVPCLREEVDALLADEKDVPKISNAAIQSPEILICPPISLRDLANLIDRDERTVQLLEERGIVVRISRGIYDRDRTIAALWQAYKDAEQGTTDEQKAIKTKIMQEDLNKRQAANYERLGKLLNADRSRAAWEMVLNELRQDAINMPKKLGPECDMLAGTEIEIKLNDWVRRFLKKFSTWEQIVEMVRNVMPTRKDETQKRKKTRRKK